MDDFYSKMRTAYEDLSYGWLLFKNAYCIRRSKKN
jgi:hypothetical protein